MKTLLRRIFRIKGTCEMCHLRDAQDGYPICRKCRRQVEKALVMEVWMANYREDQQRNQNQANLLLQFVNNGETLPPELNGASFRRAA